MPTSVYMTHGLMLPLRELLDLKLSISKGLCYIIYHIKIMISCCNRVWLGSDNIFEIIFDFESGRSLGLSFTLHMSVIRINKQQPYVSGKEECRLIILIASGRVRTQKTEFISGSGWA